MSAAFRVAFGSIGRGVKNLSNGEASSDLSEMSASDRGELLKNEISGLVKKGSLRASKLFSSPDDAATEVLKVTSPLSRKYNLEVGGSIIPTTARNKTYYQYTIPKVGGRSNMYLTTAYIGYHTHPSGALFFSNLRFNEGGGNDAAWVASSGKPLYLGLSRQNGSIGIAVCEPGNCANVSRFRQYGRVLQ